jgi:hypothetical protein
MNSKNPSPGLPAYLHKNIERIKNLKNQDLGNYSDSYRGSSHPSIKLIYQRFPKKITREDIIELYTNWEDPVLAFYATMVWGMIDVHKKNRFLSIQKQKSDRVEKIMNDLKEKITQSNFSQAFESCFKSGSNFIDGVGPSYFTKIFFFIGQADDKLTTKPLIMDKWTINAYFALKCDLSEIGSIKSKFNLPSLKSLNKYKAIPLRYNLLTQKEVYDDFVSKLNSWSNIIGVNPSKLEQFVFGIDLRRDKSPFNPRIELLEIAKKHLFSK